LMGLAYTAGRYYISKNYSRTVEKQALLVGLSSLVLFSVLRLTNIYGDPGQFTVQDTSLLTVMSFFNPTKYPLSLQFMLLTVGAGLILLYCFSHLKASFSQGFLQQLGKTSMFSYIVHLYLLHLVSWLLIPVLGFKYSDMTYGETLIGLPEGFGLSYGQTYLFALFVLLVTVILSKYYLAWKLSNKQNLIAKYI